jgi:hypothetical protein
LIQRIQLLRKSLLIGATCNYSLLFYIKSYSNNVFVRSNFREIIVKLIYTTLLAEIVSYCIECICLSGRHVTFHCVGTSGFSLVLLCLFKGAGDLIPTTAQDGGILNLYNAQLLSRPHGGLTAAACEEVPYREPRWY